MKVTKKELKSLGWTAEQLENFKIECYQAGQKAFQDGLPVRIHDNKVFTESNTYLGVSPVRCVGFDSYNKGYSHDFCQDMIDKMTKAIELEKSIQA